MASTMPVDHATAGGVVMLKHAESEIAGSRTDAARSISKFHGVEPDDALLPSNDGAKRECTGAELAAWMNRWGVSARTVRLKWRHAMQVDPRRPILLLLTDGHATLLVGYERQSNVYLLKHPMSSWNAPPVPVDEFRLSQIWDGDAVLVRRAMGAPLDDAPFTFGWIARLVTRDARSLRDIIVASFAISVLQLLPPFLVMIAIDKVITHRSLSTLTLIAIILGVIALYEALLGHGRREIIQVLSTRIDARLSLHIFRRLLSLPIDYFERTPTGETTHRIAQLYKVREFLTGKLIGTFLDFFTLLVLLPFLFWMSATLASMVLAAAVSVAAIIMAFLPAIRRAWGDVIDAETRKGAVLVETMHGMRTVKSLAMEEAREQEWDERVAEAGHARLRSGRLASWPHTLVTPLERFIDRGVLLIGAYLVITAPAGAAGITTGGLIAFLLLGARVASPLVNLARLIEDLEDVRSAAAELSKVVNHPTEAAATRTGMRPSFKGSIRFADVSFSYPGARTKALEEVSFEVAAGTMLGVVGRSGSGKSTLTRLIQGINRDYEGSLKIDDVDLRSINLKHLRRSFGVVMQDNFLFRGTVQENIIARRPGITLDDAVRAARAAGAEEFIERLPAGYDTWIEEGSSNLSGGQRQRLAIARALVADPRILILDEATSALDPESEAIVNANLTRIGAGRTMVIVSHRLASLVRCDQILVMDKGRALDIGRHGELIERCHVYRQLWLQQSRHLSTASVLPTAQALART